MIYLDHAAATPLDERVLTAMQPYFSEQFFNPSSPYEPAIKVRRAYGAAKDSIARVIGARAEELVMTAGATESINLALHQAKGHVITTAIEHPAVLEAAKLHDCTLVGVNDKGRVDPQAIKEAIRPNTELVSVALANNELGTIQPLADIATVIAAERQTRREAGNNTPINLHTDASQGVGQLDIHVSRLGVDMMTLNSAKMYGPKQVGLLYASRSIQLKALIVGGGQEQDLRGGTENVAGVIGFARALELVDSIRKSEVERLTNLRDELENRLIAAFPDAVTSADKKHRLAGHLHISFPGLDAERLVFLLEAKGVLVATGSACAANKATRSHVLVAIGLAPEICDGSLRLTLGHLSTPENTQQAAELIIEAVSQEKERMR